MAIAYRTSAVGGNVVSATNPTVAITPVVGDLFLVFCQTTGNVNLTPTCSDNNSSGAYTLLFAVESATSANTLSCFVRTTLLGSTASTTVTVAIGAHVATEVCVVAVSGAPVAGIASIVQYGTQSNQLATTTPAPALTNAPLFGDVILSAVGNATNPAGVSKTANTQIYTWTLAQNTGQTACGLGVEYSTGVEGALPGSAVTWGSTSASAFASCAIEVGAGAANAGVNTSKLVSTAVLAPPKGVVTSKLVSTAILTPPAGVVVSKLVSVAVLAAVNTNPPSWPVITPPNGYTGNSYILTWDLTSAAPPTTYTLFSGSLPPGLTLTGSGLGGDGNLGKISGTPTTVGTYNFILTATNAYGVVNSPTLTINIYTAVGVTSSYAFIG